MASLPPIRRLYLEDYESQKSWIGQLLYILNTFMTSVVAALNKNLTLVDNTTSDIKTVTLSTPPSATAPATVSWSKPLGARSVTVGNVVRVDGASFTLSSAVDVQWAMGSNTVLNITNVVGITPSSANQYTLTLLCVAG